MSTKQAVLTACHDVRIMLGFRKWFGGVAPAQVNGGVACQVTLLWVSDDILRCVPSEVKGVPVYLKFPDSE